MNLKCGGQCVAVSLLILISACLLTLGYWWLLDKPINGPWYRFDKATVMTPQIVPGQPVEIYYEYEVLRDCRREVEVWLFNHGEQLLNRHTGRTAGKEPSNQAVLRTHELPILRPGMYSIAVKSTGYCTPLQIPEVIWTPKIQFEVIAP